MRKRKNSIQLHDQDQQQQTITTKTDDIIESVSKITKDDNKTKKIMDEGVPITRQKSNKKFTLVKLATDGIGHDKQHLKHTTEIKKQIPNALTSIFLDQEFDSQWMNDNNQTTKIQMFEQFLQTATVEQQWAQAVRHYKDSQLGRKIRMDFDVMEGKLVQILYQWYWSPWWRYWLLLLSMMYLIQTFFEPSNEHDPSSIDPDIFTWLEIQQALILTFFFIDTCLTMLEQDTKDRKGWRMFQRICNFQFILKIVLLILQVADAINYYWKQVNHDQFEDGDGLRFVSVLRPVWFTFYSKQMRFTLIAIIKSLQYVVQIFVFFLFFSVFWGYMGWELFKGSTEGLPIVDKDNMFNEFGTSCVAMYAMTSLDNYPEIFTSLLDGNTNYWPLLFFIPYTLLIIFVILPIPVAVIFQSYKEQRALLMLEQRMNIKEALVMCFICIETRSGKDSTAIMTYQDFFKLINIYYNHKAIEERVQEFFQILDIRDQGYLEIADFQDVYDLAQVSDRLYDNSNQIWEYIRNFCNKYLFFQTIGESFLWNATILLMVFVNTGLIIAYGIVDDEDTLAVFDEIDTYFNYIYLGDVVIKLVGDGFEEYFKDTWHQFDFFMAIITIFTQIGLEYLQFLKKAQSGKLLKLTKVQRTMRIFRSVRSVKMFKFLHLGKSFVNRIKNLLFQILYCFPVVVKVFLSMFFLFYVYAIIGMILFNATTNQVRPNSPYAEDQYTSFDDFGFSLISLFQVCTQSGWVNEMYDNAFQFNFTDSFVFFISFHMFIIFFMISLLRGLVWDMFNVVERRFQQEEDENKQQEIQQFLQTGDVNKKIMEAKAQGIISDGVNHQSIKQKVLFRASRFKGGRASRHLNQQLGFDEPPLISVNNHDNRYSQFKASQGTEMQDMEDKSPKPKSLKKNQEFGSGSNHSLGSNQNKSLIKSFNSSSSSSSDSNDDSSSDSSDEEMQNINMKKFRSAQNYGEKARNLEYNGKTIAEAQENIEEEEDPVQVLQKSEQQKHQARQSETQNGHEQSCLVIGDEQRDVKNIPDLLKYTKGFHNLQQKNNNEFGEGLIEKHHAVGKQRNSLRKDTKRLSSYKSITLIRMEENMKKIEETDRRGEILQEFQQEIESYFSSKIKQLIDSKSQLLQDNLEFAVQLTKSERFFFLNERGDPVITEQIKDHLLIVDTDMENEDIVQLEQKKEQEMKKKQKNQILNRISIGNSYSLVQQTFLGSIHEQNMHNYEKSFFSSQFGLMYEKLEKINMEDSFTLQNNISMSIQRLLRYSSIDNDYFLKQMYHFENVFSLKLMRKSSFLRFIFKCGQHWFCMKRVQRDQYIKFSQLTTSIWNAYSKNIKHEGQIYIGDDIFNHTVDSQQIISLQQGKKNSFILGQQQQITGMILDDCQHIGDQFSDFATLNRENQFHKNMFMTIGFKVVNQNLREMLKLVLFYNKLEEKMKEDDFEDENSYRIERELYFQDLEKSVVSEFHVLTINNKSSQNSTLIQDKDSYHFQLQKQDKKQKDKQLLRRNTIDSQGPTADTIGGPSNDKFQHFQIPAVIQALKDFRDTIMIYQENLFYKFSEAKFHQNIKQKAKNQNKALSKKD